METLKEFCEQNGIPLQKAINYLKEKYAFNASPDMTLRDIAFSIGERPYQLAQELMTLK
jgi:hypothetical protein